MYFHHYKFILRWRHYNATKVSAPWTVPDLCYSTACSGQLPGSQLVLPWLSSAFCVRAPDLQFHLNEEALLFFNQAAVMSRGTPQRVDRTTDLRSLSISHSLLRFPISLLHTLSVHIFIRLTFSLSVFLSCIFSLCFFLLSLSPSLSSHFNSSFIARGFYALIELPNSDMHYIMAQKDYINYREFIHYGLCSSIYLS